MSVLTVSALFTWGVPLVGAVPIAAVCIALVTGDIYYNRPSVDGTLRKWHRANRVAAFILLGLNVAGMVWTLAKL